MRYKEARIKNPHEMRGQTKAQVENRSRETAATGVTKFTKLCAYARSIEARVSQICAYARDRVNNLCQLLEFDLTFNLFLSGL